MSSETVDFLLTQYLDGDLPPRDRLAVQCLLNNDPNALARMNSYRQLDRLLCQITPLPPICWEALAQKISAAIPAAFDGIMPIY